MSEIERHLQQARRALADGRLADVQVACAAAARIDASAWEPVFLIGMGAMNQRAYAQAERAFARAAELAPNSALVLSMRAMALSLLGRTDAALQTATAALQSGPGDAFAFGTLAAVFGRAGAYPQAAALHRKAVETDPQNASAWVNLGYAEQHLGRLGEAETAFRAAIDTDPRLVTGYVALADLRTQTPSDNLLGAMTALYPSLASRPEDRLRLGHALAKACDDLGRYGEALDWLDQAKAEQRARAAFSIDETRQTFAAAASTFQAGDKASGGFGSSEPIFVVGMPRTGTTLAARILAAHPDVTSAEELQVFPLLVKRSGKSATPKLADADTFSKAANLDHAKLGADYVEGTRPLTGKTPRFVDKLPFNFLYAGLIHRALPDARIVCLRRDGMDTVLNNYRQRFAVDSQFHDYTTRLEDVAGYFVAFDGLVAHWRRALPEDRFLELSYEALVEDPKRQSQRLLGFCGLEWDDRVLAFHQNAAGVATASSVQVRAPIYATSIGRWKRYGDRLAPAAKILADAGLLGQASS